MSVRAYPQGQIRRDAMDYYKSEIEPNLGSMCHSLHFILSSELAWSIGWKRKHIFEFGNYVPMVYVHEYQFCRVFSIFDQSLVDAIKKRYQINTERFEDGEYVSMIESKTSLFGRGETEGESMARLLSNYGRDRLRRHLRKLDSRSEA